MLKKCTYLFFTLLFALNGGFAQNKFVRIATWNIEHLGSGGRGFPEIKTDLPKRQTENFEAIAKLIKDDLKLDLVGVQEVKRSFKRNGKAYSNELYEIVQELGDEWHYYLACPEDENADEEMQNAFIYNTKKVRLISAFEMPVPDYNVGPKSLFDRVPLVGYFETLEGGRGKNEKFIVVNLHLASGQQNDENHLAAMVIVEQNLGYYLGQNDLNNREYDRIILGDFNDNPFKIDKDGDAVYIPTMYDYLKLKGYKHLVDASFKSTRMSKNFNSIIDHILVSRTLRDNVKQPLAKMYVPSDTTKDGFYQWRRMYSDHFPVYIDMVLK